jgi:hypothetical protein
MNLRPTLPDNNGLKEKKSELLARSNSYRLRGRNSRYDLHMGSFWTCDKFWIIEADSKAFCQQYLLRQDQFGCL